MGTKIEHAAVVCFASGGLPFPGFSAKTVEQSFFHKKVGITTVAAAAAVATMSENDHVAFNVNGRAARQLRGKNVRFFSISSTSTPDPSFSPL
jgi:hypothetical protein